jgi:protein TonB
MSLRCLLFSSDEATAEPLRQILADLGIEAEHCPEAVQAVERVTTQAFHLVIVDWDNQPEAGFLLNSARERKAAERPLALAIVGNDTNVPQALQAGASSILRKPIQINQAKDTLTTARGFLRAKYEAAPAAHASGAGSSTAGASAAAAPALARANEALPASEKTLRAGEFLQSGTTPGSHLVTESEVPKALDQVSSTEVDSLKELEPMAGSVEKQDTGQEVPLRLPDEPRGLAWYMKARPAQEEQAPPAPAKAELLSFSDAPAHSHAADPGVTAKPVSEHEQRTEAALFAYISGETPEENEPKPRRKLGRRAILGIVAAALVIAYFAVPQSVWRPKTQSLVVRAARAGHSWLNPQPVTTAPAPPSHENFGRAGDEYKLPVAENIPDATTDPSQIRVVPVIDPTAKLPNGANTGANQASSANGTAGSDQTQTFPVQTEKNKTQENQSQENRAPENKVQENQTPDSQPSQPALTSQGDPPTTSSAPTSVPSNTAKPTQPGTTVAPPDTPPAQPPQHKQQARSTPVTTNTAIPSSLKSQMASTTPQASGNKPVEAALPSIEPVDLPETTARGLLLQQTDIVYPPTAKGQQGTVVLQLLIGRDGTVQDAKFLQGSLAFARAAIDSVKQWRFKPYLMNTHPASVQTVLTLTFKPPA